MLLAVAACWMRALVILSATISLAAPAAAQAAINGFEGGDGNQDADCSAASTDWRCLTEDQVLVGADASGPTDDAFDGGSKETEPGAWSFKSASVHDKADIVGTWSTVGGADQRSFLEFAFHRTDDTGTTYLGIELNQSRQTWTNDAGATIPCREDGDVLVSYEVSNPPTVRVYGWTGTGPAACPDGAIGTWDPVSVGPSGFEAAMNYSSPVENFLRPGSTTFATGTFGETAIDLRSVADAVQFDAPCEYFRQVSVKSRSSDTITASLNDWVAPSEISARACETPTGDTTPPDPPLITSPVSGTTQTTDEVVLVGTAEPNSTVTVYDGPAAVGFANTDADGNWTLTLVDVAEGAHVYTAEATDAAGNTSPRSNFVIITIDLPDPVPPLPPTLSGSAAGTTVTLTGTAAPGATVTILENGAAVGTATAGADGTYTVVLTDVTAGDHTYVATASNGGGTSSASQPAMVTVTLPPGPDPDPDPSPSPSPSPDPDPSPTADPDPSPTADPDPSPTADPDPSPTASPGSGVAPSPSVPAATGSTPTQVVAPVTGLPVTTPTNVPVPTGTGAGLDGGLDTSRMVLGDNASATAKGCVTKRFNAYVTLKGVRSARFMVDGKLVRTVRTPDRNGHFVTMIDPTGLRLSSGPHKLTALVTFRNTKRSAKTVSLRFRRCDTCQSRRAFRIRAKHLRNGERAVSAKVYVNGKQVKVVRGKRLRAMVVLKGLPKGQFKVTIKVRTNRGRTVTDVRRYKTCTRKGG